MKYEKVSNAISIVTGALALGNIEEILSIIILIISIANILFNMGMKMYNHIKNKNYEAISNELEKTKKELENLKKEGK